MRSRDSPLGLVKRPGVKGSVFVWCVSVRVGCGRRENHLHKSPSTALSSPGAALQLRVLKFLRQDSKPHREYTHQLDAAAFLSLSPDTLEVLAHPSPYAVMFGSLSSTTRPSCRSFLCVGSNLSTHVAKLRAWGSMSSKTDHNSTLLGVPSAPPPDLTAALSLGSGR